MKLFGVDLDERPLIVAEVGVNHEGSLQRALDLVRLAKKAGADAVKIQSYTPERYASASDPERLKRITCFALDFDDHRRLADLAGHLGIGFFSTPLSEDWVAHLAPLVPAYKIGSGDLTFEPVIRAAAATGKPVILSTGLGSVDEIDQAVQWVGEEIGSAALADRLILMQCVSAYPTPVEEANVAAMVFLRDRYGLRVGYSNHVIGPEACYAATALGADIIEVHFTDCKTGRDFRDHELSFEPADLATLVAVAPRIRAGLGDREKGVAACELANRDAIRKGIVAACDLAAGKVLTRQDLGFARPASEFAAAEVEGLIGRVLVSPVCKGHLLHRADLEDLV